MLARKQFIALKDDGCNTNVLSKDFVRHNRAILRVFRTDIKISHSRKTAEESSDEMVTDTELQIGAHRYNSNWAVVNCRYDVLLDVPWHTDSLPGVCYETKIVSVDVNVLPSKKRKSDAVQIEPCEVKKCTRYYKRGRSRVKSSWYTSSQIFVTQIHLQAHKPTKMTKKHPFC